MKSHPLFILSAVLLLSSCLQQPDVESNDAEGNLHAAWRIIQEKYCYLSYKQINWDSVYIAYTAQLDTVKDDYQLFDHMASMLAELKDGHVNLLSDFNRSRYWNWYTDYPLHFQEELIYGSAYLGNRYRAVGGLRYERIHGGQVGYVYYGSFSNGFTRDQIREMLYYFRDCSGMILDVRNNGGGSLSYSETLASYFMQTTTHTGYIQHKTGPSRDAFSEPTPTYTPTDTALNWAKPVVVLTNRMSYSATNDFVNRMKQAPYAWVLGDQTGGGGGMPMTDELPNGWLLRYSASPMLDVHKNHTEWGIEPDAYVELNSLDVVRGIDSLIEAAVDYIAGSNK